MGIHDFDAGVVEELEYSTLERHPKFELHGQRLYEEPMSMAPRCTHKLSLDMAPSVCEN
jgi:hypothetical protein